MILPVSSYNPDFLFKNNHFNTIYRTLFQNLEIKYIRKRLELEDGDFMDLDFSLVNSSKIAIVIHGLEGSSNSNYIKSLTSVLNNHNFDVVAINLRGCSGELNRKLSSYHSGKTDDLDKVIRFIQSDYSYDEINLIGFSLGGNMILKYLGEQIYDTNSIIKSAVTVSAPCDLKGSSVELSKFWNNLYMKRFLISLKKKLIIKSKQFPDSFLEIEKIKNARNFFDLDNLYTAPAHGFKDAFDYWEKSSSKQFIPHIKTPALLITSKDDPFLSRSCIPTEEAKKNPDFTLELTNHGGHVGFNSSLSTSNNHWLENRIIYFLSNS